MPLWGASAKGGVGLQSKGGVETQGGVSLQRVGADRKGCGINAKDFRQVGSKRKRTAEAVLCDQNITKPFKG